MPNWPFASISRAEFLSNYWQQKPCLIRQAFNGFSSPISPEELAGLACEPEAHARLVFEQLGDKAWQCINGPFSEEDFLNLPEKGYSLLVSNCEQWIPECLEMLQNFRFVPDWRLDDLMISYAPDGGSVGPHFDQYDVFLLQAWGKRRWMLDPKAKQDSALLKHTDLRILQQFEAEEDWLLEPGDMLYLPPGLAHYGVADGPCMTWSIGFRALSQAQILEACTRPLLENEAEHKRYTDVDLQAGAHPAEITHMQLQHYRQLLQQSLQLTDRELAQAIGKRLTDLTDFDSLELDQAAPTSPLPQHLIRPVEMRCCYIDQGDSLLFFAAGHSFELPPTLRPALNYICDQYRYDLRQCESWMKQPEFSQLLQQLWQAQFLENGEE